MGKQQRREQEALSPKGRADADEEPQDEEEQAVVPSFAKRDRGSEDGQGAHVLRVGGFCAVLIFFVVLAVWNPHHGVANFRHRHKKKTVKHMWPPLDEQRDERKNLADMINYHRQALSPDQIVILDHRSEDALTKRVLHRFNQAGGHVWRCERDYAQHRADMMSRVMRLYAPYSTFLVPLDADEMLAVHQNESLTWSSAALGSALHSLPDTANLFKVRTTAGVPHDCPSMPLQADGEQSSLVAEKCLGAAKPLDGFSCGSRTFYRGESFHATDDKNAIGATTAQPDPLKNAGSCLASGLDPLYHRSPLVIVHFQVGSLNDLVMRVMRQAARLSPARCNQKDRPHVYSEVKELQMYCQWHAVLSKAELNLTAARQAVRRPPAAAPPSAAPAGRPWRRGARGLVGA